MKKENGNFKLVGGLLAGMIIGGATVVGANQAIQALQNTEIKVSLNGQVQEFKDETTGEIQHPITYHDRTYLPLRNVAQLTGLNIGYDEVTNTAMLNKYDFFIAKETYNNENKIYEQYGGMDYYLSEDGKILKFGDGTGYPDQALNGFKGKVVSAIAVVRGDPSGYEFPLYVLSDNGYIYQLGIGETNFTEICVDQDGKNVLFTDIAVIIDSDKPVVVQVENGLKKIRYCEYYEIYGKTNDGKIVLIDLSTGLWS